MREPIILITLAVRTNFLNKSKLSNLPDNAKDLPLAPPTAPRILPHIIKLLPNASKEFIH